MTKMICGTDLTPASDEASAVAGTLASELRARLELLHVLHLPAWTLGTSGEQTIRGAAADALDRQAAPLSARGADVAGHVDTGAPTKILVRRAKSEGAELIIVGGHARRGRLQRVVGGVAEGVVRESSCPVLVVPSHECSLRSWRASERPLRVLAAVDLAPASEAALAWLGTLRQRVRCDTRFIHLYEPAGEHERFGLPRPDPFETDPDIVRILTREIRSRTFEQFGVDVPVRVRPRWGAKERALAWEVGADDTDMLVLATGRARDAAAAVATLREARVPVLCVPWARLEDVEKPIAPCRTVLVTTDFSRLGHAAVAQACRLLAVGGGDLILLHVAAPPRFGLVAESRHEIETALLGLLPEGLAAHSIHAKTLVAVSEAPGEAILQAIRRLSPDVVVMCSHGRSGVGRAVAGSVAERVVRGSPRPVLIVPPAGGPAAS